MEELVWSDTGLVATYETLIPGRDDFATIRSFSAAGQRRRWTSLTNSTVANSLALCLDMTLALPPGFARVSGLI